MSLRFDREFTFAGCRVAVSLRETASLYAGINDWCQCAGCTNFQRVKETHFPANLAAELRRMGVNPLEPTYYSLRPSGHAPEGWVRYEGHCGVVGTLGAKRTKRVVTDEGSRLWLSREAPLCQESEYARTSDPSSRFFACFAILMPWILTPEEERDLGGD